MKLEFVKKVPDFNYNIKFIVSHTLEIIFEVIINDVKFSANYDFGEYSFKMDNIEKYIDYCIESGNFTAEYNGANISIKIGLITSYAQVILKPETNIELSVERRFNRLEKIINETSDKFDKHVLDEVIMFVHIYNSNHYNISLQPKLSKPFLGEIKKNINLDKSTFFEQKISNERHLEKVSKCETIEDFISLEKSATIRLFHHIYSDGEVGFSYTSPILRIMHDLGYRLLNVSMRSSDSNCGKYFHFIKRKNNFHKIHNIIAIGYMSQFNVKYDKIETFKVEFQQSNVTQQKLYYIAYA